MDIHPVNPELSISNPRKVWDFTARFGADARYVPRGTKFFQTSYDPFELFSNSYHARKLNSVLEVIYSNFLTPKSWMYKLFSELRFFCLNSTSIIKGWATCKVLNSLTWRIGWDKMTCVSSFRKTVERQYSKLCFRRQLPRQRSLKDRQLAPRERQMSKIYYDKKFRW